MPYGYYTQNGYKGLTNQGWILFESENAYLEYINENA